MPSCSAAKCSFNSAKKRKFRQTGAEPDSFDRIVIDDSGTVLDGAQIRYALNLNKLNIQDLTLLRHQLNILATN